MKRRIETMSKFQSRHYIEIARVLKECKDTFAQPSIETVQALLDDLFENDNPNYDPVRFRNACRREDHGIVEPKDNVIKLRGFE